MRGRLEARIVVPVGGWAISATNGAGGPSTVTIPAGTYYLSTLISTFQTQLNASRPNGWTVTGSLGESGTGLITINCSSVNWSITWTATDLRDVLGFIGNIAARASSLAASYQSYSLWMPDCTYWAPIDLTLEAGFAETDLRQTESPAGTVKTLYGNKKTVLEGIRWDAISAPSARNISGTITGFELWWLSTQLNSGGFSYFTVGSRFALYPNADNSNVFWEYALSGRSDSKMPQSVQGWTGRYRIELPRLVVQT